MTVSIKTLIGNRVIDNMIADLQTSIDPDDPTYAPLIRQGLLQADPTDAEINILVYPNDRFNPDKWVDSVVSGYNTSAGIYVPAYEIGNGEQWWRRFLCELVLFFPTGVDRTTARDHAAVVASRAERAISQTPLWLPGSVDGEQLPMTDSFGETALELKLISSSMAESGGDDTFIWRGKIWFQLMTNKAY